MQRLPGRIHRVMLPPAVAAYEQDLHQQGSGAVPVHAVSLHP